jgi:Mg2+/citrate symporter
MEYFKLILGLGLTVTFIWLLMKNSKRTSFVNALLRVDTILGLVAGVYLVFTSTYSLLIN